MYELLRELDDRIASYQRYLARQPDDQSIRSSRIVMIWFRDRLQAALEQDSITAALVEELEAHPTMPNPDAWKGPLGPEPPERV